MHAVLVQRARVPSSAETQAAMLQNMVFEVLKVYLQATGERPDITEFMNSGSLRIKNGTQRAVMLSILTALQLTSSIYDLKLIVLANFTDVPFVMGDCPCVFYNRYLYGEQDCGTLGLQTPGLMIFLPIDSRTHLVFLDPSAYILETNNDVIRIIEASDVAQLNALQVHAARDSVYFAYDFHGDYVCRLVDAHRPGFLSNVDVFKIYKPGEILIDGLPNNSEVLHSFEAQLPIKIDLSFLRPLDSKPDEARGTRATLCEASKGSKNGRDSPIEISELVSHLLENIEVTST